MTLLQQVFSVSLSEKPVPPMNPNCSRLKEGQEKRERRNNFRSDEKSIPGSHGLFRFLKAMHQGIWQKQYW